MSNKEKNKQCYQLKTVSVIPVDHINLAISQLLANTELDMSLFMGNRLCKSDVDLLHRGGKAASKRAAESMVGKRGIKRSDHLFVPLVNIYLELLKALQLPKPNKDIFFDIRPHGDNGRAIIVSTWKMVYKKDYGKKPYKVIDTKTLKVMDDIKYW